MKPMALAREEGRTWFDGYDGLTDRGGTVQSKIYLGRTPTYMQTQGHNPILGDRRRIANGLAVVVAARTCDTANAVQASDHDHTS